MRIKHALSGAKVGRPALSVHGMNRQSTDSEIPMTLRMSFRVTHRICLRKHQTLGKQVRKRANTASCMAIASCIVV